MASSSFLQGALLQKSTLIGHFSTFPKQTQNPKFQFSPSAKFNPLEILGGRGLCNGEAGLQEELKKTVPSETAPGQNSELPEAESETETEIPEDGFGKELLGLTGGFPGGEKGLLKFILENPPPKKQVKTDEEKAKPVAAIGAQKPKPPQLPMLLPGMIVIVKNENSPYHMYCGIVQRITDGKAGVLFEGGVWDRLITFRLEELERRQKGPPMVNPRSAILETRVNSSSG